MEGVQEAQGVFASRQAYHHSITITDHVKFLKRLSKNTNKYL